MSASNDCPRCPKCGRSCGTRVGGWTSIAVARSLGPSHLACAACGEVWEASAEDVAKAAKADAAWIAKHEAEVRR